MTDSLADWRVAGEIPIERRNEFCLFNGNLNLHISYSIFVVELLITWRGSSGEIESKHDLVRTIFDYIYREDL